MSYRCYICSEIITGDVRCLFAHLRSIHFVCELRGVTLKCGQGDCVRCYKSFNSLARHLHDHHSGNNATSKELSNNCNDELGTSGNSGGPYDSESQAQGPSVPADHFDSHHAAATFVASMLSSSSVTQRTVQTVIEHTSALVRDIVQDMTSDVITTLRSATVKDLDVISLQNRLQQHANPFELINTQYKCTAFF